MISFKRPEDIVPSVLVLLALVILAGTLAVMVFVPKPGAARGAKAWASTRRRIADNIMDTKKQGQRTQAAIQPRLWHSGPEAVTAAVLNQLTVQAAHRSLKLASFRPAQSQAFENITELRFDAQIIGPYAGVRALLGAWDERGSKIVLRSAQMGLSQASGSNITATLGLSAFAATGTIFPPAPVPQSKRAVGVKHG